MSPTDRPPKKARVTANDVEINKACRCCERVKEKIHFSKSQWKLEKSLCLRCAEKGRKQKQGGHGTKSCRCCKRHKEKLDFSENQWNTDNSLCLKCAEKGKKQKRSTDESSSVDAPADAPTRACRCCQREKNHKGFSQTEWIKEHSLCVRCSEKGKKQKKGVTEINFSAETKAKECRCCKREKNENSFSPTEWKKGLSLCARCSEKGKAQKGMTSADTLNHEGQSVCIMLAKHEDADAKLLSTVIACTPATSPLVEDLPHKLTLYGYTDEAWAAADNGIIRSDGTGAWHPLHLRSLDRDLSPFFDSLASRRKAAFGTFVLPNGMDGFFVVPFDQPDPPSYLHPLGSEHYLFGKCVWGLGMVKSDTDLDGVDEASIRMKSDQECSNEASYEYKWPETDEDENTFDRRALLKSILCSQCKTEEHLDTVPKQEVKEMLLKNDFAARPEGARTWKLSSGHDWYGRRLVIEDHSPDNKGKVSMLNSFTGPEESDELKCFDETGKVVPFPERSHLTMECDDALASSAPEIAPRKPRESGTEIGSRVYGCYPGNNQWYWGVVVDIKRKKNSQCDQYSVLFDDGDFVEYLSRSKYLTLSQYQEMPPPFPTTTATKLRYFLGSRADVILSGAHNDAQPVPLNVHQNGEERCNAVVLMPDIVPSATIGEHAYNQAEYEELRKRYLERRQRSGAELPNGVRLRKQTAAAAIDTAKTPGYAALRKEIDRLEANDNHEQIYWLLKRLAIWEQTRAGPFPIFGSSTSGGNDEVAEMVDMTLNDEEDREIIDVDTFILEDLLMRANRLSDESIGPTSYDATRVKAEPDN